MVRASTTGKAAAVKKKPSNRIKTPITKAKPAKKKAAQGGLNTCCVVMEEHLEHVARPTLATPNSSELTTWPLAERHQSASFNSVGACIVPRRREESELITGPVGTSRQYLVPLPLVRNTDARASPVFTRREEP
ncbi:hypothetical protein B0H17DRAFT_1130639 [Mycena rosella]|uniref:Uncharacterized protein n=1 Tax=Mycena rosella TaxID=1033263 RepID=A0AAD7DQ07_MYCRO|nr:hypothetical protein B0H17DRAFT_1130639 [Mycena rosella]